MNMSTCFFHSMTHCSTKTIFELTYFLHSYEIGIWRQKNEGLTYSKNPKWPMNLHMSFQSTKLVAFVDYIVYYIVKECLVAIRCFSTSITKEHLVATRYFSTSFAKKHLVATRHFLASIVEKCLATIKHFLALIIEEHLATIKHFLAGFVK